MAEVENKHQLSRRGFLKAAAIGTAGAVGVASAAGVLSGCSSSATGTSGGPGGTSAHAGAYEYEVFDTDVLVIGAGNSALAATWQALKEGRSVTVVDKSIFRKSGASGWSWGCYSQSEFPSKLGDEVNWLIDVPMWKKVLEFWNETWDPALYNSPVYQVNHGQLAPDRDDTGQMTAYPREGWSGNQYFRREMDQLMTMSKASVYDNTMVTNLLIQDGTCYGVVGVHVPTGKFRVFRAKATVNCSGAAQWIYGWVKTKPVSLGGSDTTGDLLAIEMRNGIATAEHEFAKYDFGSVITRMNYGTNLGADYTHVVNFLDNKGNKLFPNPEEIDSASKLAQAISEAVAEGKGSENGGVYLTFDEKSFASVKRRETRSYFVEELGFDPVTDPAEVLPEMFDKFGGPLTDNNMMTEVKGLFDCRAAGGVSIRPVPSIGALLKIYGGYTGHCAAEYAKENRDYPTTLNEQSLIDECARLTNIRTREEAGGLRPHVIREIIQKGFYDNMSLRRTKEGLEAYLTELERIRTEEINKMSIVSHSPTWNKEWKEAIENYNLLDVAEAAVRATLMREESRFQYIRPDFPEVDDENWYCYVVVTYSDGRFELVKQDIPTA